MLKKGGKEMSKSIRKMYNKILEEEEIPKHWEK